MVESRSLRVGLILCLLAVLSTLFVAYGAGVAQHDGPPYNEDAIAQQDVVGEEIQVGGTVVGVDPVTIEVDHDGGTMELVIDNAPEVEVGNQLTVSGTLVADRTIEADRERAVVRETWEIHYMYVISVVGGLLVAARIGNEWRFSAQRMLFEPRERTLYKRYKGDEDG